MLFLQAQRCISSRSEDAKIATACERSETPGNGYAFPPAQRRISSRREDANSPGGA